MRIGWTTLASESDAEKFAHDIIEDGLAVCAQVDGPIRSFYIWEGKLERASEYRVTVKFLSSQTERLESWIPAHHPYEIPQWLSAAVDRVLPAYREWAEGFAIQPKILKPKKDILRLSKLGRNSLRKGRYLEAEKIFLEALELDGKNAYILVGLGDTYRELNKFEDSIQSYEKVLEFDPVNVFALRGIGDSYRGILQHTKAIPYWLRYLERNKDDIYVMVRLAESFNKTGDFDMAESFYLQALTVNPQDKYALLGLGSLYYKIEEDEKALKYFDLLLDLDSNYVAVLTMAGNIYRRRQDYITAAGYYEKAAALEERNSFALYGLGDCQRGMENLDLAVYWWSKILEKEPENQDLLTRIGDAMLNMDKPEESVEHYQKSLAIGFDLYALLGLSRAFLSQGKLQDSIKCCEEILTTIPNHHRALEVLLDVYNEMGDSDKVAEIQARLDLSSRHSELE
jgi:tetratricopeptide (TPR) repeat protein